MFGPGRREVADQFFGDYPRAVQDAERFLQVLGFFIFSLFFFPAALIVAFLVRPRIA